MARPKHIAEYTGLRLVCGLVRALPYRAALSLAWLLASAARLLARRRVREAERRIRLVFGDRFSEDAVRRIAWLSLRNMAFNAVDMMRMGRVTLDGYNRIADHAGLTDPLLKLAERGEGAIIASAHMGSWELAAAICHRLDIPIFSIAAPQRNPLTNKLIDEMRGHSGVEAVARGSGTMRQVVKRLRNGEFLAILLDVRMRTPDITAPFLGGEANLGTGMARFARQTGVPVYPTLVRREGWTRHIMKTLSPIVPDPSLSKPEDIKRMTLEVVAILDAAIRETPEQWFWYNKRWVRDPL